MTAADIEYGSSVCGIKEGDTLSLRQLLYGMMIASGNDAAMMIAEHVGGSVDNFVQMMNEEAAALGAVNTHFMNPHGLTNPEHYTSVYDIYLIFQDSTRSMTPFRILSAAKIIMQNIREADGSSASYDLGINQSLFYK